jgi:hypothetical protein
MLLHAATAAAGQTFEVVIHREIKELPRYGLTIAKGGSKLTPSGGEGDSDLKPGRNRKGEWESITRAGAGDKPGRNHLYGDTAATGPEVRTKEGSVDMIIVENAEKIPTDN